MFARVSYERYPREHHEASLRIVREDLLPALRRAPDFRGCSVLADGKPGTFLIVALWETEEAADAASARQDVVAAFVQLTELGLRIESRQLYEVVVRDEIGTRDERVNELRNAE